MSWESRTIPKLKDNITQYPIFEDDLGQSFVPNNYANGNFLPPSCCKTMQSIDKTSFMDDYSSAGFCREFVSDGYRGDIRSGPPTSYQIPQSPVEEFCTDLPYVVSKPPTWTELIAKSADWKATSNCKELADANSNHFEDGTFLFATTDNAWELKLVLSEGGLEIQNIWKTRTPGILAVLFKTHEIAKQAFTRQKEIGVRLVPQCSTRRYWYKNPSPNFHVIYETTRRLTVKSGKSLTNTKVGDFLMKNSRMERGCIIWADQMKGYRLRIVGFVGKFVRPDGRVIVCNYPPSIEERKVIGWVSTQCNITKTKFVLRLSGNQIEDYLYTKVFE